MASAMLESGNLPMPSAEIASTIAFELRFVLIESMRLDRYLPVTTISSTGSSFCASAVAAEIASASDTAVVTFAFKTAGPWLFPSRTRIEYRHGVRRPWQYHLYDNTQPENLEFLRRLRRSADRWPDVVMLGEVTGENLTETMREYTSGSDRLHLAYNFKLLADEFSVRT